MIFKNSLRLLLTNFSNVWKVLVYYTICVLVTFGVCWSIASPIIEKLTQANVFNDLLAVFNGFFYTPQNSVPSIGAVLDTAWAVITQNIQFRINYIFLIVWVFFVFPFMLDLAQLPMGEVLYGFMTSQVKYSFTGRFIKNIGKSCGFSLLKYIVDFVLNVAIMAVFVLMVKLYSLGSFLYILLDVFMLIVVFCFFAFKHALFCCFMPSIAVLDCNPFKALKINFKNVGKKFFSIYSNFITLLLCAVAINVIFCGSTLGISLIITLPLTAFAFAVFKMVSFFSCQGMRFYVYPDMFITPKTFEEQDRIKKMKYIV